jgi:1-acyl-sn-glycerol-3-phosphate acyltransferase
MKEAHSLLRRSRFAWFFGTQLLSAFNDNFLKNAIVLWVSSRRANLFGISPEATISLASALFIAPFFLLSASAGQLADRFDKARVIRGVKLAEVLFMALAAVGFLTSSLPVLIGALVLMGAHSAVLGPAKYSILPEIVAKDSLVEGNALVETGSFLAILAGTIGGGVLVLHGEEGPTYTSVTIVAVAVLGVLTSLRMPKLLDHPDGPTLDLNPLRPTFAILRIVHKTRAVFLSVLGISWFWFLGAVMLSLLPVYTRQTLHAHEHVFTLFLCVFCVGIAIGSALTERISGKNLELGLVPVGSLGMTAFLVDLYFAQSPLDASGELHSVTVFLGASGSVHILLDLFGVAVFGGLFTVPLYTLIQERSPAAERSRVVAGNNILNALMMVAGSALLAGLFGAGVAPESVFLVLAGLSLLVAIYIYTLLPEFLIRFMAWFIGRIMYRQRVYGHDNIPTEGPVVLVANHVAFNDWLIMAGAVRRPPRFVMDHRIAKTPLVSVLFKHGKTIPIAPAHEDQATMEQAFVRIAEELREGEVVCIYPEGKITKTGEMNPFKNGIERIIRETPVQVVPVAIHGLWGSIFSRKGGPAMQKLPRRFRAKLVVNIGKPVPAAQVTAAGLEADVRALLKEAEELAK